ncbi:MAG TPA: PH domain-containing protein [Thermoanaerobaculia bacterium]|nr:PH domain-containing protein [Thermoanaerobaculia bacterium]
MAGPARRFPCTPGGAILQGRRRLRLLLVGLAVLMLVVALAAGAARRIGPSLVALAVAFIPWFAWRMSGDLDPFWLEMGDGWLIVQMRRRRERFAIAGMGGAHGRRLTPEEIAHLETLATSGGVAAGTGGFESHLLGELDLFASDLAHAVLVDLDERRIVVTPDDPAGFLEALSSP